MCYSNLFGYCNVLLLVILTVGWGPQSSEAFGTFGFDIHHRYSDPVKGILDLDGLPEKGTHDYYAAMAHGDRLRHGRRLADSSSLTFAAGNETYRINRLGYLHYANVSVGTPSLWFLVALDTGSNLFWLPCDCISCVRGLNTRSGRINFNIYSPNTSSTSTTVPCNSTSCRSQCSATSNACPYQTIYLSNNTSSTGVLVEDVLHLTTDDSQLQEVNAPITLGCGMIQTGSLLDGGAPNGLFGLGMSNLSVPSILASDGLAANSFSMCFGPEGIGRIRFGDKGSSDQGETPFNLNQLHPTYNISMTQISVGENTTALDFTAIFDSGSSFTALSDPAYSVITESFNSQVEEERYQSDSTIPFEYCYVMSRNDTRVPTVNLTMQGGNIFYVTDPVLVLSVEGGGYIFCLGVLESDDINIIGQNFMTGHNIVFDREKMVLGWKESDCYNDEDSTDVPINPSAARPIAPVEPPTVTVVPPSTSMNPPTTTADPPSTSMRNPPTTTADPPSTTVEPPSNTVEPEARVGSNGDSPISSQGVPPPSPNRSSRLSSSTCTLLTLLVSIFSNYMFVLFY